MPLELREVNMRYEGGACTLATINFSDNTAYNGNQLVAQGPTSAKNVAGAHDMGDDLWATIINLDPVPPPEDV